MLPDTQQTDLFWSKSNRWIKARYEYDKTVDTIITIMAAQVDPFAENLPHIKISVQEILEITEIKDQNMWSRVAEAASKLVKATVEVRDDKSERFHGFPVMNEVNAGTGWISGQFNEQMRPFLLHQYKNYTRLRVKALTWFKDSEGYSKRIYELCARFDDTGWCEMTIDELREILGVEDKYKEFAGFRRRILDPSVRRIRKNPFAEFRIEYDLIKQGRSYHRIRFSIHPLNRSEEIIISGKPLTRPQKSEPDDTEPNFFEEWKRDHEDEYLERLSECREQAQRQLSIDDPDDERIESRAHIKLVQWFELERRQSFLEEHRVTSD